MVCECEIPCLSFSVLIEPFRNESSCFDRPCTFTSTQHDKDTLRSFSRSLCKTKKKISMIVVTRSWIARVKNDSRRTKKLDESWFQMDLVSLLVRGVTELIVKQLEVRQDPYLDQRSFTNASRRFSEEQLTSYFSRVTAVGWALLFGKCGKLIAMNCNMSMSFESVSLQSWTEIK